jgi:hypothetical protein
MKRPAFALSIRQPFAEAILSGRKKIEFRSTPTRRLNERVYIYASQKPREAAQFRRFRVSPDAPRGVIVGTVEISHCTFDGRDWCWYLRSPKRLQRPLKPTNHPQPV